MTKKIVTALAAAVLATTLAACGGGGATIETNPETTGQQLLDLQKAHEAGALTDKEYEKARKKVLKNM